MDKHIFDQLTPDEYQKQQVWNLIQQKQQATRPHPLRLGLRIAVPALSLALVAAVSLWSLGLFSGKPNPQSLISPPGQSDNAGRPDTAEIGTDGRDLATAPLLQFTLKGRVYHQMHSDWIKQFGFDPTVTDQQIGDQIATIDTAADPALKGKPVYAYLPAKAEAVVAVRLDSGYQLYKFLHFKSYENNQDEDAIEYLKVYGMDSADDIAAIRFIGYSEQAKLENRTEILAEVTDRAEIEKFYQYYSALKNASDQYFETLYSYRASVTPSRPGADVPPPDLPPDYIPQLTPEPDRQAPSSNAADTPARAQDADSGMVDYGNTTGTAGDSSPGSIPGTTGSAAGALANAQTIRICAKSGLYFETIYYPNIGFISRYQVPAELAQWLAAYIQ